MKGILNFLEETDALKEMYGDDAILLHSEKVIIDSNGNYKSPKTGEYVPKFEEVEE